MFSIIASRVPAGWRICRGLQTEHENGTRECSLGAVCLGADELHASWRCCFITSGAERTQECTCAQ
jgi:hypothetical protein